MAGFSAPGDGKSNAEVFRLRVVDDDGGGRLLRVQLVFLAHFQSDPSGAEQVENLTLVGPLARVLALPSYLYPISAE
jgi:hypothetical protein